VPSLPFAVGVYLPLSSSTPIFVGGLVRYVAERWGRNGKGGARSETESDTSPGVLLSTGYIAGGAIAGVIIAFLSFSEDIPKVLAKWQYSRFPVTREQSLKQAAREVALNELGLAGRKLPEDQEKEVDELAAQVEELNQPELPRYVPIPKGTVVKLPRNETYTADAPTYLGEIAEAKLGSPDKAQLLLDLNADRLKVPENLPVGASLKIPQRNLPALAAFGVLVLFLAVVGLGWLLRSPPAHGAGPDNGGAPGDGAIVAADIMRPSAPRP
jgi:hypothetical protein